MKSKNHSSDEIDELFRLPLADFTGARNALSTQLKKSGRGNEAAEIKALGKPSVSAWAVNQLYWNHRAAFDKLIASGERFHKAQKSGKMADMRNALDARREALKQLSDLAARVLKEADHNPSPDTLHRITTTLEGISAYASRDDGPQPGRLTHDVDPPGFESVGAFVPAKQEAVRKQTAAEKQKAVGSKQKAGSKEDTTVNERRLEDAREKKIAAATVALREAKKSLGEAQARTRSLDAARTRTQAELKLAEKRLKEATARAQKVEQDLEDSKREVQDAEDAIAAATKELELLSN